MYKIAIAVGFACAVLSAPARADDMKMTTMMSKKPMTSMERDHMMMMHKPHRDKMMMMNHKN